MCDLYESRTRRCQWWSAVKQLQHHNRPELLFTSTGGLSASALNIFGARPSVLLRYCQ
jgi:hypothetical protein